jgi:tetratricopeptide (TPR) repeat protein
LVAQPLDEFSLVCVNPCAPVMRWTGGLNSGGTNRMRLFARACLSIGLAVCCAWSAVAKAQPSAAAAVRSSATGQDPLVVENPFATAKPAPSGTRMPAMPDSAEESSSPNIAGGLVDGDIPALYRLPPVVAHEAINAPAKNADTPPPGVGEDDWFLEMPPFVSEPDDVGSTAQHREQQPWVEHQRTIPRLPPSDETNLKKLEPTRRGLAGDHRRDGRAESSEQNVPVPFSAGGFVGVPNHEITPLSSEPISTFPYAANPVELSLQMLPAVQRGYALAQRGAISAAQEEFIQVLRRIAQAKDAALGTDRHSQALAAGLRALDEAEDFVPGGIQLEAELDVQIAASSHRTPVLDDAADVLPHEAVARYQRFAQEQLSLAAGGEQAGSMVLHGLGKVHVRLAERDDNLHAARTAMTLYMAALATCPLNHLAANELGVLLCRNGHAGEAAAMFERTIDLTPTATTYHNLAVAQRKLGMHGQAAANEQESQRLAAFERASGAVSRRVGVEWVSPGEMAGVMQPAPLVPMAHDSAASATQPPPQAVGRQDGEDFHRSPWQRTVDLAKAILPGTPTATQWR